MQAVKTAHRGDMCGESVNSQKSNGIEMYNFSVLRDLRKRAAMTIVELS